MEIVAYIKVWLPLGTVPGTTQACFHVVCMFSQ